MSRDNRETGPRVYRACYYGFTLERGPEGKLTKFRAWWTPKTAPVDHSTEAAILCDTQDEALAHARACIDLEYQEDAAATLKEMGITGRKV